mmetsp:Transcript_73872/g.209204  ORF Transcript_73872/g.209204 Transcript_73872/m.209204 type:complete len:352 (+) Transcript_73872:682-1737(+)
MHLPPQADPLSAKQRAHRSQSGQVVHLKRGPRRGAWSQPSQVTRWCSTRMGGSMAKNGRAMSKRLAMPSRWLVHRASRKDTRALKVNSIKAVSNPNSTSLAGTGSPASAAFILPAQSSRPSTPTALANTTSMTCCVISGWTFAATSITSDCSTAKVTRSSSEFATTAATHLALVMPAECSCHMARPSFTAPVAWPPPQDPKAQPGGLTPSAEARCIIPSMLPKLWNNSKPIAGPDLPLRLPLPWKSPFPSPLHSSLPLPLNLPLPLKLPFGPPVGLASSSPASSDGWAPVEAGAAEDSSSLRTVLSPTGALRFKKSEKVAAQRTHKSPSSSWYLAVASPGWIARMVCAMAS